MLGSSCPAQLWLGVGMPHDYESFVAAAARGHDLVAELARAFGGDVELAWESGYVDLAEQLSSLTSELSGRVLGARAPMVRGALTELGEVPREGVIVIVAHHGRGKLWLADGPVDHDELCASINPNFCGEIDLVACYSDRLADRLKIMFPQATVAGSPVRTEVQFRLRLTRNAILRMLRLGGTYLENIHAIRMALKQRIMKRS